MDVFVFNGLASACGGLPSTQRAAHEGCNVPSHGTRRRHRADVENRRHEAGSLTVSFHVAELLCPVFCVHSTPNNAVTSRRVATGSRY